MNLYLLSQYVNDDYDTYDSAVVVAENKYQARRTHPASGGLAEWAGGGDVWCSVNDVTVTLLGVADKSIAPGVICASFNAG